MSYDEFMEAVAIDMSNELARVAPVDTEYLRNSINFKVVGDTIEIFMPEYALYLEYGTYEYNGKKTGKETPLKNPKRKFTMTAAERAKLPKGMEAYPFIRNTFYHKLKGIVNKNAERYLDVNETEVSYS
jgi:hypothetical protein